MLARFMRSTGALVVAVGLGAGALPANAAELITYASLPDPGYDAVVWAIENGKVSDPNVTIKVETAVVDTSADAGGDDRAVQSHSQRGACRAANARERHSGENPQHAVALSSGRPQRRSLGHQGFALQDDPGSQRQDHRGHVRRGAERDFSSLGDRRSLQDECRYRWWRFSLGGDAARPVRGRACNPAASTRQLSATSPPTL